MEKIIEKLSLQIGNLEKVIRDVDKNENSEFKRDVDWLRGVVEGIKQSIKVIKDESK